MTRQLPEPPAWIADLPKDHRGFHVPAEAGWEEGAPLINLVATDRKVALAHQRRCAVCGHDMPSGQPFYRAFSQADAAHMRQFERERSHDLSGPLHLSCILYSGMVCPYLRERNSRLGKASLVSPGARRGTLAAIIGFRDIGLLMPAQDHAFLDPSVPPPAIAYWDMLDDIRYRDGEELRERFNAAIELDAGVIDPGAPRSYWTDSPEDLERLRDDLLAVYSSVQDATPLYDQIIDGAGHYVALPIPR